MANIARQGKNAGGSRNNPGGVPPPVLPTLVEINEPRCKICQSPYRREIDACLASGWSQAMIVRHFNSQMGADYLNRSNLSRHKERHLTSRDAAVRSIIEERARALRQDTEEVTGFILTRQATLDMIIQQGLESLRVGITSSEPKDILAAIQMLEKMEMDFASNAVEEMTVQYKAFADAVQELVPADLTEKIFERTQELLFERKAGTLVVKAQIPEHIQEAEYEELEEEDEDDA